MQTVTPLRPKPNDAAEKLALVQAKLAEKPDGVVEAVAREVGVSTQIVLEALPADTRIKIGSEHFETVWKELAGWGEVLFIVNTVDIVLECKGSLPVGSFASGYYNIHGDSLLGGISAPQIVRLSTWSIACFMVDGPAPYSSSTGMAKPCSRFSSCATKIAR